jgi:diadenosine tetraphosphate (Ap4A) HIT family hydrolase
VSSYHSRLPYGQRVSADSLVGGPFFPFEGDLQVVPLADPVIPEPPRNGEPGGGECFRCADPDGHVIWRDEHWDVRTGFEPIGLPMMAGLAPREHMTLHTLTPEVVATMGAVVRRLALAIGRVDGVARTHFTRWGDGSEHFHMWFLARPLGMMQLRGPMLAIWDEMLPPLPDEELAANMRTVAAAMAEGGGDAVGAGAG